MADNTYRTSRRDPAAQGGQPLDDPLAELARLIGQRDPVNTGVPVPNADRARHYDAPPLDDPAPGQQWATDDRYAEPQDPTQAQYDERKSQYDQREQYAERYDAPPLADPAPPYRPAPPTYDAAYEQPDQYAQPAQRYDSRGYPIADEAHSDQAYADQAHSDQAYDDAHDPIQDLPAFLPRMRGDSYNYAQDGRQDRGQAYAEDEQGDPDDPSYALEDYEEEEAPTRKRRGFAIVAAILGLMVLGTAGAFAYRTMFGGAMMPSLPPIIKADNAPNKIVPAGNANASGQAASNAGAPDKLVSREEKPVDVPTPANTPRVVSTIPIFPDPNAGLQSVVAPGSQGANQSMAGQNMPGTVAPTPDASRGPSAIGPTSAAPIYGRPVAPAMPLPGMGQNAPMPAQAPVAGTTGSKKVHTVAIHPGQPDSGDAAAAAPAPALSHAPAAPRPAAPRPVAAPPQGGNAPLSIVPTQGDTAAPARPRTAVARATSAPAPAAEPAPSAGGGYSVQVSSQRSEAEAQSAYRGLQAKYPGQLGGHTPTVRQVNLGDKGVFYRTLVGPYASMEQAAQMCSSLKAAGGSCIVQRN